MVESARSETFKACDVQIRGTSSLNRDGVGFASYSLKVNVTLKTFKNSGGGIEHIIRLTIGTSL